MAEPEMRWARQSGGVNAVLVVVVIGLSWMLLRVTADRRQLEVFSQELVAGAAARQPGRTVAAADVPSAPDWHAECRGIEARMRSLVRAKEHVQHRLSTLPQRAPARSTSPQIVKEQAVLRHLLSCLDSQVPSLFAALRTAQGPADVQRLAPRERELRGQMETILTRLQNLETRLAPPQAS